MPEAKGPAPPPEKPSGRRTFVRNAVTSYGQIGLIAISALLLTPYLFRRLGIGGFGTWSVMLTLTAVFSMVEVGFAAGPTKFIAEHRAKQDRRELEAVVGAAVMIMGVLGLVAFGVSAVIAVLGTGLAAGGEHDAFRTGMLVIGVSYLLRFPLVAYGAVLTGYQRYDLFNLGGAVTVLVSVVGAVIAVEAGAGVLGVAVAYGIAFVAGGLAYLVLAARLAPDLRLRPWPVERRARRKVLGFSSFSLLADSMILIGARLDTVVIAAIRSASAAAPFAAASKLNSAVQSITLPATNLMLPMVSELEARRKREEVVRRFVMATRVVLQVTTPVALAIAFFSADIVDVWLGSDAPSVTASIMTVLVLQSLMLSGVPAQKVLLGMGRARAVGLINTAEGLLNLAISIVLVSAYGAIGAALGTLISSYLIGPANFPLACRATAYPLGRFARRSLLPALASSLPSALAMLAVWLLLPPSAGRLLIGAVLGIGVAALVGLLQLGPSRALSEIRSELRGGGPEPATSTLVAQDPA
jgi:O-antigen/teichoic acid export membrane protein